MKQIIYIAILFLLPLQLQAQKTLTLTLSEAIEMARRNSPEAIAARHAFRASYWNWRSFRAKQLPSLTLTSDPSLNRSIQSEGAFSDIKANLSFRRFLSHGTENALATSIILAMAHNVLTLHHKLQSGNFGTYLYSLKKVKKSA